MGKKSIFLTIFLFIFSFYNIVNPIVNNWSKFSEKFDPNLYEKKYYKSQWSVPNSKNPISDEELYAYSGYKYLKGINPILISPEVPPLGKYLVGTSIQIFGNQRIFSIIIAVLSLLVIAHIVYEATKSLFASSLAVFLTSINSLFIDQIIHSPQFDIFQLFFLLLFIIFFFLYLKYQTILYLVASGLSMGYFNSTKFFLLYFILMNAFVFIFFTIRKTNLIKS